ncbi:hypothetical protein [Sandarakinorhabdus sp. AAP62]|uniref:hypothetical protein n=1 Tax=Sandarakinorhabdus sp. AAP62 TaxID=1248916 RepID=UPI0002D976AE|nr:hypothetical protein [Sandarakinorhabdus sp. AAP62]
MTGGGLTGRPLRAFTGLGLLLALWIIVRLPAMQHEVAEMALLATVTPRPPAVAVMLPPAKPAVMPLRQPAPPPLLALPVRALLLPVASPSAPLNIPLSAPQPPAPSPSPPVPPPAPPPARLIPPDPAFTLASRAYDRLRAGQRRQAAALFDAALVLQPDNRPWQAERAALGRRWQVGGFALLRDGGVAANQPGAAASPVLGGGQVGGSIAWLTDPYARHPLALVARANVAADASGVRGETAQVALGLRQSLLPGVSVSVERLVPLGDATRGAFTARLAAGGRWQRLEGYGEAGVLDSGQVYAGGQARARLVRLGPTSLHAATWASVQTGSPDVWRVDVGPSLGASVKGIRLEADWGQRVGGNAAPGSGPTITVSAGF